MAEIPERWQILYEQSRQAIADSAAANRVSAMASTTKVLIEELGTAEARIRELEQKLQLQKEGL
jgi:hypothetical protein